MGCAGSKTVSVRRHTDFWSKEEGLNNNHRAGQHGNGVTTQILKVHCAVWAGMGVTSSGGEEGEDKDKPFVPEFNEVARDENQEAFDGLVEVIVVCASGLRSSFFDKSDPYVRVKCRNATYQTRIIANDENPLWNQCFRFFYSTHKDDLSSLKFQVLDYNVMLAHTLIGEGVLSEFNSVQRALSGAPFWIPLMTPSSSSAAGHLCVRINFYDSFQTSSLFWGYFGLFIDLDSNGLINRKEIIDMFLALGNPFQGAVLSALISTIDHEARSEGSEPDHMQIQVPRFYQFLELAHISHQNVKINFCVFCRAPLSETLVEAYAHTLCCSENVFLATTEMTKCDDTLDEHLWAKLISQCASDLFWGNVSEIVSAKVKIRYTEELVDERLPAYVALAMKKLQIKKKLESYATKGKPLLLKWAKEQSRHFDSENSIEDIIPFMQAHCISLKDCVVSSPLGFASFNDFFNRKYKPAARPIASKKTKGAAIVPCDGCIVVYPSVHNARTFWIKARSFTIYSLLGREWYAPTFASGAMAILRLAAQDSHRVFFPADAAVETILEVDGSLMSDSPLLTSQEDVNFFCENKRVVVLLSSKMFGAICVVLIGSTQLGSIYLHVQEGHVGEKGDLLGMFKFGGSTVVTLFEPGKIDFDRDLLEERGLETRVKVGQSLGILSSSHPRSTGNLLGSTETDVLVRGASIIRQLKEAHSGELLGNSPEEIEESNTEEKPLESES